MKIIFGDDHTLFRDGMRHLLWSLASGVEVLEAADYPGMIALLAAHADADLALVDLNMPGRSACTLEQLVHQAQTVPVVVLSGSDHRADARRALDAGAMGYIPKSESADVMLGAVRLVLSGGVYVPPMMMTGAEDPVLPPAVVLTPRQRDVLQCIASGKSNKEIGRDLGLSEATVKVHVAALFRALGSANRTQALLAAMANGLLPKENG